MRVIRIAVLSATLLTAAASIAPAQTARPRVFTPSDRSDYAPPVDVWLDQITYTYGQRFRPYFSTEPGAYVTIVRVTTDGELRVMYPRRPSLQKQHVPGRRADSRVPYSDEPAFSTYESGGTGFVFAIASNERFNYGYYTTAGEWSVARLANSGRYGDPFEIVRVFVDQTLGDRSEFSMDYVAYEVVSRGRPSRYASRYMYDSYDDYFDRCMSAFGYGYSRYSGYSQYCGNYNGYYGQFVVARPRSPAPATPNSAPDPRVKPLVPDPMLPAYPTEPQAMQGRFPVNTPGEAAAVARRERMLRSVSPRTEIKSGGTPEPRYSEPRYVEPRRAEPRQIEPRQIEPRQIEPRHVEPVRAAPRSEPRVEPAPAPPPVPVQKENQQ